MERVNTNTDVVSFLTCVLNHVLVGVNAGSLQRLRANLFLKMPITRMKRKNNLLTFHGNQMIREGEGIRVQLPHSTVIDPDLGFRDTTAVPTLRVRLILAIPISDKFIITSSLQQDFYL